MEILVRKISVGDAAAVTALSSQLGYPLAEAEILENINSVLRSNDHNAFVAVIDGKVVGWIGAAQTTMIESLPYCEVNGLVIDDGHRGKGVGKLLVEEVKHWAREKGNNCLRLRCNVKRKEAHEFYRHLGFKEIKQQTNFEISVAD